MSSWVRIHSTSIRINWNFIGLFILCRRRYAIFSDNFGPEAKFPASLELGIISREHLSVYLPSNRNSLGPSLVLSLIPACSLHRNISIGIRHLGEFTPIFEPSYQSYLCNVGNIHAKKGMSIRQDQPSRYTSHKAS